MRERKDGGYRPFRPVLLSARLMAPDQIIKSRVTGPTSELSVSKVRSTGLRHFIPQCCFPVLLIRWNFYFSLFSP